MCDRLQLNVVAVATGFILKDLKEVQTLTEAEKLSYCEKKA